MHGTEQQLAGWCWIPDSIRALIYCQSGKLTPSVFKQCPWWQQLTQISSTESAQASGQSCCSYPWHQAVPSILYISCRSLLSFNRFCSSPIHPEEANGPDTKAAQDLSPYWRVPVPLASVKYGARWNKRRTPAKDFRDYSLVLFP